MKKWLLIILIATHQLTPHLAFGVNKSCASLFIRESSNKLSDITRKHGFDFLQHYTHFDNVLEILKHGGMELPKNLSPEKIRSYNYTPDMIMFYLMGKGPIPETNYNRGYSAVGKTPEEGFFTDLNKVHLRFSVGAMDKLDFHIAESGMGYGNFKPESDFKNDQPTSKLEKLYSRKNIGEVAFYQPISLDYLLEIWVSPVRRDELISKLHTAGISNINGKSIESIVKSTDSLDYEYKNLEAEKLSDLSEREVKAKNNGNKWLLVPNK